MVKKFQKILVNKIQIVGLSPDDFEVFERELIFSLMHKKSELYFRFDQDPSDYQFFSYTYSNFPNPRSSESNNAYIEFNRIKTIFTDWLDYHVKIYEEELNSPNPWQEWKKESQPAFTEINDKDTSKFTPQERKEIVDAIGRFEKSVEENFKLNEEQRKEVKAELRYLNDATERVNKRDFKAIAQKLIYDIFTNIIANIAVSVGGEVAKATTSQLFWKITQEAFKFIVAKAIG